jgi:putative flavoprotein involved in K+ transport
LGLPWLYTWGSGRFSGIARDAIYVAEHIEGGGRVTRLPTREQTGDAPREHFERLAAGS